MTDAAANHPMIRARRPFWLSLLTLALVLLLPETAAAHQSLLRSAPADNAVLSVAPRELRLTFNQAVEPTLAQLSLVGPSGEVALARHLVPPDAPTVLLAAITGALEAGEPPR